MIPVLNFFIDPGSVFSSPPVKEMVSHFKNNKNVTLNFKHDDRARHILTIKENISKPDTIIYGSSRGLPVRNPFGKTHQFYNTSSTNATLKEFVAYQEVLREVEKTADNIVIVLDPWTLKGDHRKRLSTIKDYFDKANKRLGLEVSFGQTRERVAPLEELKILEKIHALFSLDYFQKTVDYLKAFGGLKEMLALEPHVTNHEVYYVYRPDGSVGYPYSYVNDAKKEIKKRAEAYFKKKPQYRMDKDLQQLFVAFIDDLQKDGSKIYFVVYPFPPYVYNYFQRKGMEDDLKNIEEFFIKTAQERDIPVMGSFNPEKTNHKDTDFMDARHLIPKVGNQFIYQNFPSLN